MLTKRVIHSHKWYSVYLLFNKKKNVKKGKHICDKQTFNNKQGVWSLKMRPRMCMGI